jgi:pimeloyl-ACP methyl ester carboxylesterase
MTMNQTTTLSWTHHGEGEALVLLHGNGESKEIFNALSEALQSDFDVFRYDARCHGQSPCHGELTYEVLALDLIGFLEAQCPNGASVFGFSDGAITVIEAVIRRPDLFKKIALAGVNTSLSGLKPSVLDAIRRSHVSTQSCFDALMLSQITIPEHVLEKISVPVMLIFGERDIATEEHIEMLKRTLNPEVFMIARGHDHGSYVTDSAYLADHLKIFLKT